MCIYISPTIISFTQVPKCIQILKNHLARGSRCPGMFAKAGLREKYSRHHSDKEKYHRRKYRKSGYVCVKHMYVYEIPIY